MKSMNTISGFQSLDYKSPTDRNFTSDRSHTLPNLPKKSSFNITNLCILPNLKSVELKKKL